MRTRLEEAMEGLARMGLRCGIALNPANIYYLTGFYPTSSCVFLIEEEPLLLISRMDISLAEKSNVEFKVVEKISREIRGIGYKKIGVEKNHMSLDFYEKNLKDKKVKKFDLLEKMRMIKDREEIKRMRSAVKIAESAIKKADMRTTERAAAASVEFAIRRRALSAFDAIVASGRNSAIPHHTPTDAKIKSPVIVDAGARVEHYNSDITRTFLHDDAEGASELYAAVKEAQKEAIRECYAGNELRSADRAARGVLREYGFEKYFLHSAGHGIGLEVHEEPRLSKNARGTFKEGMVVTVEPGVYRDVGVRIEDVVYVGKRPRVLSRLPK